ncbi:MAG TPA: septum formation initiator family protein [Polyangiales bacterium]
MSFGRALAWLVPFGLLVFTVAIVSLRILSDAGLPRYRKLRAQLTHIEQENKQLEKRIAHLTRDVHDLAQDPDAVERIARDELGLLREGELLFQFSEDDATFLTSGSAVR